MPKLAPMPMSVFFELPVGAKVFIRWDKDDNPADRRLNDVYQITSRDEELVWTDHEWDWSRDDVPDFSQNLLDTSRGYAYFFYPPENKQ